ncbi:MAG: transposase [Kiritimatiellae bacterium]|nr:transposase [Kiritimatiellia bacterium]
MRHPRLKPEYRDTWHHCYNRVVGTSADRPLDDADKEQFVRILHRVATLYAVRIVAYQVMSNHFHLLLQAPAEPPSEEETIERFEDFHAGKRKLLPGSPLCRTWQARLRDVSWCLRHLQHLYTAWYNRSRPIRRRGPLWAGRFKNTVLDTGTALWVCWTYIERNPVRAGMVTDPGDYRFCSYGAWVQTGRHPFAESFQTYLLPALPDPLRNQESTAIRCALRKAFAALAAAELKLDEAHTAATIASAASETAFSLSAERRVRHWVDGLAIGSELFVRETMRRVRSETEVHRHRLAKAANMPHDALPICCWRRLRVLHN